MGKIGNHAIKTEKYFGTVMSVCQQVNIFEWKFQLPTSKYSNPISIVSKFQFQIRIPTKFTIKLKSEEDVGGI